MKKMFVKTGDTVQVLSGKSKGVKGEDPMQPKKEIGRASCRERV